MTQVLINHTPLGLPRHFHRSSSGTRPNLFITQLPNSAMKQPKGTRKRQLQSPHNDISKMQVQIQYHQRIAAPSEGWDPEIYSSSASHHSPTYAPAKHSTCSMLKKEAHSSQERRKPAHPKATPSTVLPSCCSSSPPKRIQYRALLDQSSPIPNFSIPE
jgi:hypothetical protein